MNTDAAFQPDYWATPYPQPLAMGSYGTHGVAFLRRLRRDGSWSITGIWPEREEKRPTPTKTFGPVASDKIGDADACAAAIDSANTTGWNVYYSLNPTRGPITKKAEKVDILAVEFFHVDIDVPAAPVDATPEQRAEHVAREKVTILRRLTDDLPEGVPTPTFIIDSGGGFQALWRLRTAIPLADQSATPEEKKAACAEVERYNRWLEDKFGADNCHNVDRVLRLPGTTNHPDKKKRLKGRVPTMALLVAHDPDAVYEPDQFGKAPPKSAVGSQRSAPADAAPATDASPDQLPTDELRRVARDGMDKAKPSRWHKDGILDRSRAVCWWLCECIRHNVPQSVALGILTNKAHGIADSIADEQTARVQWDKAVAKVGEKAGSKAGDKSPPSGSIVLADGHLNDAIRETESALAEHLIFDRGGELVRPIRFGSLERKPEGVRRDDAAIILRPVTTHWMVQQMEGTGLFVRRDRNGNFVKTTPDLTLASHLLNRAGEWPYRQLAAVVNAPAFLADGSVLQTPGYHAESGLLYDPLGMGFATVPEQPTRADAIAALAEYHPLYERCDFVPTDAEAARDAKWHETAAFAVVLGAHLTGLARPALRNSPAFIITAPYAGSAKTKIAECIAIGNTGRTPAAVSFGPKVEEFDKLFYVIVREGDPCILIDNVSVPLGGSDPLCQAVTSPIIQCRILGVSERMLVPNRSIIVATGINVAVKGDLTRRVVVCNLDPGCEKPENRKFDFDPVKRAMERWPRLAVAGLTALRAYAVAGYPQPDGGLKHLGSFEDWTRIIRGCLVWCGYGDPADTRLELDADDPARSADLDLLRAWHDTLGDNPVTVAEIGKRGHDDDLCRALVEFSGVPVFNAKSIGRRLLGLRNRIVGGLVLRRVGNTRTNTAKWCVESRQGQQQLPFPDYAEFTGVGSEGLVKP